MTKGVLRSHSILSSLLTVFLISWSVIHLQLALIRVLSVTRWHHFSYLVISTALLGYALSGSLLQVLGKFLQKNFSASMFWLSFLAAALGNLALIAALKLPLNSQYLFYSSDQIATFVLFNVLLVVPFFLSASVVGLSLVQYPSDSSRLYGTSLLACAFGGVIAILLMYVYPEERLIQIPFLVAAVASLLWIGGSRLKGFLCLATTILIFLGFFHPAKLPVEPHKGLFRLQNWQEQGDASHILTLHSPRGRLDVYSSPLLHYTLFAGITARQGPPPQFSILRDGNSAGTKFEIHSATEAPILDYTPSSLAYRLRPNAKVLLLGETGGVNVWLARRFGASHITVVQPDPQIVKILLKKLTPGDSSIIGPDLDIVVSEPRLYLETTKKTFDIIHLVSAEESAAETHGAEGLFRDYLLTEEGLRTAFQRLTPIGILTVTRGIQIPERDSLKLLTTLKKSFNSADRSFFQSHLVMARNYLAETLLLFRSSIREQDTAILNQSFPLLAVDAQWPPGMVVLTEKPKQMEVPGTALPSVTESASKIFSEDSDQFVKSWMYDIRPSTDDRPYFRDFFRLASIGWMRQVYRDLWFQREELGFAILLLVLVEIIALGFFILLVPAILWRKNLRRLADPAAHSARVLLWPSLLYFLFIGVGFMALEINWITTTELLIGDPVLSATIVISLLLAAAGIGSIVAGKFLDRSVKMIVVAFSAVVISVAILYTLPTSIIFAIASHSFKMRCFMIAILLFPTGFFLGFFFPAGLHLIRSSSEALVPWAWGSNGFASVVSPPLATILGMTAGHRMVFLLAAASYGAAGAVAALFLKARQARFQK